ncbi:MAG: radical SAM protein [Desulfovibrio sp.]|jgi:nitrogen fixation protein NifB|nr:radical SAM protein [Desulfovibrio sp.]
MNATESAAPVSPVRDASKHPCFNKAASGTCGRVHLPVAPGCNIQCNYCDRQYDCANESRPGVTSAVLKPRQALEYMHRVLEAEPRITVAGIAGPGDPMANPEATLETMRLLREAYPHLLFCLSSNGLAMPAHLDDLAAFGVTHATVTCNAADPAIGASIYAWVRDGRTTLRGQDAAELLLHRQKQAIAGLKARGIAVKVNTIVIPGVNDTHVTAVAEMARTLGADLHNMMPLHPNPGTPFADVAEPSPALMENLRLAGAALLPQMTHCRRCRADAVGLLCEDRSGELAPVLANCGGLTPAGPGRVGEPARKKRCGGGDGSGGGCGGGGMLRRTTGAALPEPRRATSLDGDARPYVAVASRGGLRVNLHLGKAQTLHIWEPLEGGGFRLLEERILPAPDSPGRWEQLARGLHDCRALLVEALGDVPRAVLTSHGVNPVACSGMVLDMLHAVYGTGAVGARAVPSPAGARQGADCAHAAGMETESPCLAAHREDRTGEGPHEFT